MKASELNRIAKKAEEDGYDQTVEHFSKKIKGAARVGLFEVNIPIIPWYNFEHKHAEFFIRNGFKVSVGKDMVHISWKTEL